MSTDTSFDVSLDYNTLVTEIDALVDINSKCYELLGAICNAADAAGMLDSGYLIINAFNTVNDIISGPIRDTTMNIMSVESLFNIFQNQDFYTDYFSNVDKDGDGNPDIDYNKLLTVMVSLVNTQEECFQLVENYDEVLERYSVMLRDLDKQIAIYEQSEIVDLNSFDRDYIVQQIEKQNEALSNLPQLRSEYAELANIMAIVKNIRDYTYDKGFLLYGGAGNFDELSGDVGGRIASHEYEQVPSRRSSDGYTNNYDNFTLYDANGNLLTGVSEIEVGFYFISKGLPLSITYFSEDIRTYSEIYRYLNESELKVANYLYNSGDFDKLEEFLQFKESYVNGRKGAELAQGIISEIDGYYANAVTDVQKNIAYVRTLSLLASTGFVDGVASFCDGFYNLFAADGEISVEQYKTMEIIRALNARDDSGNGKWWDATWQDLGATGSYEVFNSIGNMTPSMIIGAVTHCPQLGSALMGISAAGNAREQGLQSGMSNLEAWQYGILSGASEGVTEYLLGGIPYLSSADELADLFKNPIIKNMINAKPDMLKFFNSNGYRFIEGMASEGIEEMFQTGILEPTIGLMATGELETATLQDILKSGIYGSISSGITQGTVNTGKGILNLAINHSLTDGPTIILNDNSYAMKNMSKEFISQFVNDYANADLSDPNIMMKLEVDLEPYRVLSQYEIDRRYIPISQPQGQGPTQSQSQTQTLITQQSSGKNGIDSTHSVHHTSDFSGNNTTVTQQEQQNQDNNLSQPDRVSQYVVYESENQIKESAKSALRDKQEQSLQIENEVEQFEQNEVMTEDSSSMIVKDEAARNGSIIPDSIVQGSMAVAAIEGSIYHNTVSSSNDVLQERLVSKYEDSTKDGEISSKEEEPGSQSITSEHNLLGIDESSVLGNVVTHKTKSGDVVGGLNIDATVQDAEGSIEEVIAVDVENGDIRIDIITPRNILIEGKNFVVKMCSGIRDYLNLVAINVEVLTGFCDVSSKVNSFSESAFKRFTSKLKTNFWYKKCDMYYEFSEKTPNYIRSDPAFILKLVESKKDYSYLNILLNIDLSLMTEVDIIKFYNYTGLDAKFILENSELCHKIFSQILYSNSQFFNRIGYYFINQILNSNNPKETLDIIEKVFLRNDIPFFGKQFLVFQTLYPDFTDSNYKFGDLSRMSPQLKDISLSEILLPGNFVRNLSLTEKRFIIIYNDLLRIAIRSNSPIFREYLMNIDRGNNLFLDIYSGKIEFETLSFSQKTDLEIFTEHLEKLYLNTKKGKRDNVDFSVFSLEEKLKYLGEKFKPNGKYDLRDKIVTHFAYSAGYTRFEDIIKDMDASIREADARGRKYALELGTDGRFMFKKGDFVRGLGDLVALSGSLDIGNVCKEFMTLIKPMEEHDTTPLDIDITMIDGMDHSKTIGRKAVSIYQSIAGTATGFGFGNIFYIIKGDNPNFNITRDQDGNLTGTGYDPSKVELFGTHVGNSGAKMHWGARTGISMTDVDYILYKRNCSINKYKPYLDNGDVNYVSVDNSSKFDYELAAVKFEIARHGFYVPVIDFSGKLIFTVDEYEALRTKMSGLSHYGITDYKFSKRLDIPNVEEIASRYDENVETTKIKREKIETLLRTVFEDFDLTMQHEITGDLTPGVVELIDTGSTGRGTNSIDGGDFDFLLRVDQQLIIDAEKFEKFKANIKNLLCQFSYNVEKSRIDLGNGDFRLKSVQIDTDTVVDIDISIAVRTDKIEYSSDECLKDRLRTMNSENNPIAYRYVVANIIEAKRVLKEGHVYKPHRSDNAQGGIGGIGIENWVLQHGGSFVDAAESFVRAALGDDWRTSGRTTVEDFDVFKSKYSIWDFGQNHFTQRNNPGSYLFDEFIDRNMSESGYGKMVEVLREYLIDYYDSGYEGKDIFDGPSGNSDGGDSSLSYSDMDDGELL